MVALYNATDGANWSKKWLLDTPLEDWHGVNNESGCVVSLDLRDNKLSGELPEALGNLLNLTQLHLSVNPSLSGEIPEALGKLSNLETLNLGWNSLSGEIPKALGLSLIHI